VAHIPVAFRVRSDRIDQQLLAAAELHQHIGTLAEAEARPSLGAVSLTEIVRPEEEAPSHFGRVRHSTFVGRRGP
jgi:hypothetical protein